MLNTMAELYYSTNNREEALTNRFEEARIERLLKDLPEEFYAYITAVYHIYLQEYQNLKSNFYLHYQHFSRLTYRVFMDVRTLSNEPKIEYVYDCLPKYATFTYQSVHQQDLNTVLNIIFKDYDDIFERFQDAITTKNYRKLLSVTALLLSEDLELEQVYSTMKERARIH